MRIRYLSVCLVAGLMVFGSASCSGLSEKQKEGRAHYKLGVSLLNGDRVQAAYVEFQKSLDLNPDDKEAHNALGIVHIKLEEIDMAIKHFERAVSIDGNYSEAYNNLCFVYYGRGEYEKAVKNCELALGNKLYQTPEKSFYNLGRSYYRMQKYSEAITAFENSIKRYSNQPEVYYALALAFNANRMYGKAAEAMAVAIKADPKILGDREKAELEFKRRRDSEANPKDVDDYLEILKY